MDGSFLGLKPLGWCLFAVQFCVVSFAVWFLNHYHIIFKIMRKP